MDATLKVSEIRNAGFGDFYAVIAIVDGKELGADCYQQTGEVIEWPDGNGLIAHGIASANEIRLAVMAGGAL